MRTNVFRNRVVKLILLMMYIILLFFWIYLDLGCVFRNVIGIPCPGCGLTRAWISFLQGNWIEALQHHFMFWSVPVLIWYLLYHGQPIQNKKINYGILGLVLVGWILNYIVQLVSYFSL